MSLLWLIALSAVLSCPQAPPPAGSGGTGGTGEPAPRLGTSISEQALKKPLRTKAKLAAGTIVSGDVTAWDGDGFQCGSTRVAWLDLVPSEFKRLYDKVMDDDSIDHWLRFAELQTAIGLEPAAQSSWKKALSLDKSAAPRVEASRKAAAAMRKAQLEKERMAREGSVQDFAADGTAPRWPVLTDAERDAALTTMREDAKRFAAMAGVSVEPIETEYFILVSELRPAETKELQKELDGMYRKVLGYLGVDPKVNLFWGKAVIFLFATEDRFKAVEAGAFQNPMVGRPGSGQVMGLCHMMKEKIFVNSWRCPDYALFGSVLIHETVHGIMHRFSTPARLPAWADEGFSDWVAAQFQPASVERARRDQAMQFIRSGGNIVTVLDMNYRDGSWPGQNALGYAVGYAVVDAMMREDATRFEAWLRQVKGGVPWEEALQKSCSLTKQQLAANVARFFSTRD
jgi:hypothetical protein